MIPGRYKECLGSVIPGIDSLLWYVLYKFSTPKLNPNTIAHLGLGLPFISLPIDPTEWNYDTYLWTSYGHRLSKQLLRPKQNLSFTLLHNHTNTIISPVFSFLPISRSQFRPTRDSHLSVVWSHSAESLTTVKESSPNLTFYPFFFYRLTFTPFPL